MKKLVATGMVVASTVAMANAIEIGGVKITPNIEAGWQKGEANYSAPGSTSNGDTYTQTADSNAKAQFGIGQLGVESQYRNYFGGVRYTHDKFKGTRDYNYADSTGYTYNSVSNYSKTMERYLVYGGYQFNLSNVELKPYLSAGYFNTNADKGNFAGIGVAGKVHLPYGTSVFASAEYDKVIGGKVKDPDATDKDVKGIWEISAGIGKKIGFADVYVKTYYREHQINATLEGDLGDGTTYKTAMDHKLKVAGLMIGLNF
jgi:hypothetical protein